jgi:hypothetical protein
MYFAICRGLLVTLCIFDSLHILLSKQVMLPSPTYWQGAGEGDADAVH